MNRGSGKALNVRMFLKKLWKQKWLFVMTLPGLATVLVFNYFPMYGVQIAFKNFNPMEGIWNSPWVGLTYFESFFANPTTLQLFKNTLLIGVYSLLWSFPMPIILALLFNELRGRRFKKLTQTISYFPFFISTVILCGMIREFVSRDGLINQITEIFGAAPRSFLLFPEYFRTIYISSGIWQGVGFGSIIYLAALTGVDPEMLDAASIDGANRFQKIYYIHWPAIQPTTIILLIFAIGGILGNDFTKILLLKNAQIESVAGVIGTYTFEEGIQRRQFEYTTAIGLFMSVIGFMLISITNWVSKKVSDTSLW